jgi:hypothetical protein
VATFFVRTTEQIRNAAQEVERARRDHGALHGDHSIHVVKALVAFYETWKVSPQVREKTEKVKKRG